MLDLSAHKLSGKEAHPRAPRSEQTGVIELPMYSINGERGREVTMKKISILIVALVIVAVAVFVAVAVDNNTAAAFPTGWAGGCGNCHDGFTVNASGAPATHNVASHSSIYPSNCAACHTGAPAVGTADASKCAGCHGGADALANKHGSSCLGAECHAAAVTTTTVAQTTTTAVAQTTTTAVVTTSTTPPITTPPTTTPPTTTPPTTMPPTTTTTVASGTGTPTG